MIQLQWHDGTTKNVHVDPVVLSGYQVCLMFFDSFILLTSCIMILIASVLGGDPFK